MPQDARQSQRLGARRSVTSGPPTSGTRPTGLAQGHTLAPRPALSALETTRLRAAGGPSCRISGRIRVRQRNVDCDTGREESPSHVIFHHSYSPLRAGHEGFGRPRDLRHRRDAHTKGISPLPSGEPFRCLLVLTRAG
eukprot:9501853-Pyramimonas_sp.AAC.1